jgi:hypothetical protein
LAHCWLTFGDHIVLTAPDIVPDAEYALFDPSDIELSASGPGTTREMGYVTTAAQARTRLARIGVTVELANEAAAATHFRLARAYARGWAVRCVVNELEPAELFEGRTFDASGAKYLGLWMDLPALCRDLGRPEAASCLQALHLAALLAERPDYETVSLATATYASTKRPGERTYKRVHLEAAATMPDALRNLVPDRLLRDPTSRAPSRAEVLSWLDERATWCPTSRTRLASLKELLSPAAPPSRGPLAHPELWELETRLSFGETEGIDEALDAIERRDGRLPGTMYIRSRVALIRSSADPRAIAERVSNLSRSMSSFHELELLAAHAWAEAGDARQARAFARDLADNSGAPPALRARATEILDDLGEAAEPSSASQQQPVTSPHAETMPAPASDTPLPTSDFAGFDLSFTTQVGATLPALRSEPVAGAATAQATDPPAEFLASLSLPSEPPDEPRSGAPRIPRTTGAARFTCTHLARELGRELSLRHGVNIRLDVQGLECAQSALREALPDGRIYKMEHQRSIMRTGAFLSELLARRVGARWVDLESSDPGLWAMRVASRSRPGEATRIWPIGRVLRFIVHSHKERDLVSYYLELEARSQ